MKNRPHRAARDLLPPPELRKIVGSESSEAYLKAGESFFKILRRHARLRRSDRVLDVGCGCGRMALPMTRFLEDGSYDGFDVVPELIEWAQSHITPKHANFRFALIDVANAFYYGQGGTAAKHYRFPYEDDTFDFTMLASVYTHMLKDDFVRYAGEVARTLKPGGAAVMTFFLLNEDSRRMKEGPRSKLRFPYPYGSGGTLVEDPTRPEGAVAYPEEVARSILARSGLDVQQILFGSWCGRERAASGQDVVIARKRPDGPLPAPSAAQRLKRMAQRVKRRLTR